MQLSHSYSSLKQYENCPKRYYHQRITKEVVDVGGEASKHGERIHKFLEERLKKEASLPQEVAKYEELCASIEQQVGDDTLLLEQELTINEKFKQTGWFADDAWLRSKLDVLIIKPTRAIVMDWKTGKRRPDYFQLDVFAAQTFLCFGHVEQVTSGFVWLPDNKLDSKVYTRDKLPALLADIVTRTRRIEESVRNNIWPAKPSGLCAYCPCKGFCEFAK